MLYLGYLKGLLGIIGTHAIPWIFTRTVRDLGTQGIPWIFKGTVRDIGTHALPWIFKGTVRDLGTHGIPWIFKGTVRDLGTHGILYIVFFLLIYIQGIISFVKSLMPAAFCADEKVQLSVPVQSRSPRASN